MLCKISYISSIFHSFLLYHYFILKIINILFSFDSKKKSRWGPQSAQPPPPSTIPTPINPPAPTPPPPPPLTFPPHPPPPVQMKMNHLTNPPGHFLFQPSWLGLGNRANLTFNFNNNTNININGSESNNNNNFKTSLNNNFMNLNGGGSATPISNLMNTINLNNQSATNQSPNSLLNTNNMANNIGNNILTNNLNLKLPLFSPNFHSYLPSKPKFVPHAKVLPGKIEEYPQPLKDYLHRAYSKCKTEEEKGQMEKFIKNILKIAKLANEIYTRDWKNYPLPILPRERGGDELDLGLEEKEEEEGKKIQVLQRINRGLLGKRVHSLTASLNIIKKIQKNAVGFENEEDGQVKYFYFYMEITIYSRRNKDNFLDINLI